MATTKTKATTNGKTTRKKAAPAVGHAQPDGVLPVPPQTATGSATHELQPTTTTSDPVARLQLMQRQRAVILKSRNMQANRLQAVVAGTIGYHAGMDESDRAKKFVEATTLIRGVVAGTAASPTMTPVILASYQGISALESALDQTEKEMRLVAGELPVVPWLNLPAQRGFGILGLAIVVGECGDLRQYANPAKLWRRMGCAPWTHNGKTLMGATWRSGREGSLPKEEWAKFGYSPRRRSISYLLGDGLVKQNGPGPYRARYVAAKVRCYELHADWKKPDGSSVWTTCTACEGEKVVDGATCPTCGGTGVKCQRANLHGMLLATKLLYKNLWLEWHRVNGGVVPSLPHPSDPVLQS